MVSGEALKKLQEQIAAWPITQRFVVQQLIEDYSDIRKDLLAYEDTGLTPKQCENAKVIIEAAFSDDTSKAERIRELLKADKDGRVVVRPCKVGDTLFRVFAGEILEHKVRNMRYLAIQGRWDIDTTPFCSYVESSIGKTIFLTHEQAEKALEEMKDVCP